MQIVIKLEIEETEYEKNINRKITEQNVIQKDDWWNDDSDANYCNDDGSNCE